MAYELRITASIPLSDDAMTRSRKVAGFEAAIDALTAAATAEGGTVAVDVVRPKVRPALMLMKGESA